MNKKTRQRRKDSRERIGLESNESARKKKKKEIQFLAESDIDKGATGRQSKLVY